MQRAAREPPRHLADLRVAIFAEHPTGITVRTERGCETWTCGHLEKFLSPSRHESDSVTARGHGRMERAGHGAEGLFRCCAQAGGDQRSGRSAGNDQEDRAMGGFPY